MIDGLLLLLTFTLGALLSRVSLCAVAAMQQLVVGRSASGLGRLLLAASGAALSLLLLAGLLPGSVWLPVDAPLRAGLIAGGALLGLGAMINGGCYLGSVLYLGTGNLNFLFTLAGIGIGLRATAALFPASIGVTSGLRMASGPVWIVGVCVCVVVIVLLIRTDRITSQRLAMRWVRISSTMTRAQTQAPTIQAGPEAMRNPDVTPIEAGNSVAMARRPAPIPASVNRKLRLPVPRYSTLPR